MAVHVDDLLGLYRDMWVIRAFETGLGLHQPPAGDATSGRM